MNKTDWLNLIIENIGLAETRVKLYRAAHGDASTDEKLFELKQRVITLHKVLSDEFVGQATLIGAATTRRRENEKEHSNEMD